MINFVRAYEVSIILLMDSSGSSSFSSWSSFSSMDATPSSVDDMNSSASLPPEDQSQDDDVSVEGNFDQPLYPGAHLTFFESHLQVFQYALRHHLTKVAFADLLNLIDNHLPTTNSMVSLYKLKKHFLHLYRDITYTTHFCCSSCHASLSNLESSCPNDCDAEAMEFLSISVEPQLKRRLEGMFTNRDGWVQFKLCCFLGLFERRSLHRMFIVDSSFWDSLQQRFSRPLVPGILSDVLDGSEYKKHHSFVSQPSNVTFTLNTDGVSLFRSSSVDLWPIWLAINELPPKIRYVHVYNLQSQPPIQITMYI